MSEKGKKHIAYNFQVDKRQLDKAKTLVNLPAALRAMINTLTRSEVCPCCGALLEKKK